jgi:SNF2 family DNA or RNA helicase
MKISRLPVKFADIKGQDEGSFSLHNRIINMAVEIKRSGDGTAEASLGGYLQGNEANFVKCESNQHNWLIFQNTIFPLPVDAPIVFEEIFRGDDFKALSDRKIFELKRIRDHELKIFFHENLTTVDCAPQDNNPDGLEADLYPYQKVGWNYMARFLKYNRGIILADEMGLGKTLQAIAWMCSINITVSSPILIICPSSLLKNWARELKRFAPKLNFIIHHGSRRAGIYSELQLSDIVISSYETVSADLGLFSAFEWRALVCDEAQALKTPGSNRRNSVAEIGARNFIAITGTPVENSLTDLWSIMDLAEPGMLSNLESFMSDFPDNQESGRELSAAIKPFLLRRSVKEVADDLPPRIDIDIPITMNADNASEYRKILEETKLEYPNAAGLVATIRLQVFCTHPSLRSFGKNESDYENARLENPPDADIDSPKLDLALSIISEAFSAGEKVLVFSQFNGVAEIFRHSLRDIQGLYFEAINGSTDISERQQIIDEFSDHLGIGLLVLNPKAAGVGLNITAANVVLHFSPLWNPALEDQASARSFRRGQDKPVRVYHLFYEKTVEEVMIERLIWKRAIGADIAPTSSRDDQDLSRSLELLPEENS